MKGRRRWKGRRDKGRVEEARKGRKGREEGVMKVVGRKNRRGVTKEGTE